MKFVFTKDFKTAPDFLTCVKIGLHLLVKESNFVMINILVFNLKPTYSRDCYVFLWRSEA